MGISGTARRDQRGKGEESRGTPAEQSPPPPQGDVPDEVLDAVGAAEDIGGLGIKELAGSLVAAVVRGRQVVPETRHLAAELARVAAGRSDLTPAKADWRFKDPAWQEHPAYRRLCQSYLATSGMLERIPESERLDWRTSERARLAVSLLTSAMAPTNTLAGNPAALKRTFDTAGRNLLHGARNFARDVRHNGAMPSQVDLRPFRVGGNLAVTPGRVVLRDDVFELLQYEPSTPTVRTRPVLMLPPQINRYYFMDLAPGRSFVEHAVANGLQFFVISWRNPTADQSHWDLDTYVAAALRAIDAVTEITGSEELAMLGLCAGGITMATLLAVLAARRDERVAAAAFGVTLLDFDVPTPIGTMSSPRLLGAARKESAKRGVLEAETLARLFSWMRPNDLIWNYWVNNYLMGNDPPAFDILAWNSDGTRLPGALHAQFLDIFERNLFRTPGAQTVLDVPIDLSTITCDTYVTGALTDHLTPWQGCYQTTQLVGGDSTFVLSNAGHIASLVNPPGNPKAKMFVGPPPGPDHGEWLAAATERHDTWWRHWVEWVTKRAGAEKPAPIQLGSGRYPPGDAAPGQYVHGR